MLHEIILNKQKISVELGHTIEEWEEKYSAYPDIWRFNLDDIITGAIYADTDMVYWLIDGRLYETDDYIL